ncbi:AAA family ATPase [Coleofasciculus sp. FACHB-SPT36]|uniref:AAA family ATPase n=1 Tax=Cyanophyceae TaxID=3028117 RepID=UPI00168A6F8A|nr:AAA family ATPase [Coleofasciculus sp. FACHB-SPT36]MBD2539342.1 AAA family ATPase [Coleofasciculus sp. FACHB-SPT36]
MTRLILLIGLPCSGKSSLAQQLVAERPQHRLIATDAIREQLFGDEAIQGSWLLVWSEVQRQFSQAVEEKRQAIFDATNAARKHRREAIATSRDRGFTHITGLWLDTPVQECLERNRLRLRQVPEEVILQMHRQLVDAPPTLADGLDRLIRYSATSTEIAIASVRTNRTYIH